MLKVLLKFNQDFIPFFVLVRKSQLCFDTNYFYSFYFCLMGQSKLNSEMLCWIGLQMSENVQPAVIFQQGETAF